MTRHLSNLVVIGSLLLVCLAPARSRAQEAAPAISTESPDAAPSAAALPMPNSDDASLRGVAPAARFGPGATPLRLRLRELTPSRLADAPDTSSRQLVRGRRLVLSGSALMAAGAVAMVGTAIHLEQNRPTCGASDFLCLDLTVLSYLVSLAAIGPTVVTGGTLVARGQTLRRRGERALFVDVAFTPRSANVTVRF